MSILDAARSLLTPDLVSRVSAKTGESDVAVSKGLGAVIPMVLASLAGRSDDSSFMDQFASLAGRTADVDTTPDSNVMWGKLTGAESTGTAQTWMKSLFGDGLPAVVGGLSRYAGVKSSTASTLFALAMPLLLNFFGRMMRTEKLDATGLADRLRSDRKSFAAAVPPELDAFIPSGVRTAETAARTAPRDVETMFPPSMATRERATDWVLPVILGALALSGLMWWWGHGRVAEQARNASIRLPDSAVGTGGVVDFQTKTLPDRVALNVPKGGMEDRLTDYLGTSPASRIQQSFDFDRIGFDTNSAALTQTSREQIQNIAAILRAYPDAQVTIAGYTDDVGDQSANLQLSRSRAEMVTSALRETGIPAGRMQARGYGSEQPIASNSTEEGRARNRRVTLIVDQQQ